MKRIIMFILFALGGAAATCADDAVKLVYPIEATNAALDASTPAKRVTPPVVEDSEYDPVTPIGQIRSILESLGTIEEKQTAITNDVAELRKRERVDLSGVFTKSDGAEIKETLNNATTKLASIASAPARSKLIDWTTLATFALVVLQTVILCGQTIAAFVRSRRDAFEEEIAKRYLEKQQTNSANKSAGGII